MIAVELVDLSTPGVTAPVVAATEFPAAGQQPPIAFVVRFDPAQIKPSGTYALRARITLDGQVLYITDEPYLVLIQGRPVFVDMVLEQVG